MPKQVIQTSEAAGAVGAYSQGIRAGDFIFVQGCGPLDPQTGRLKGEAIEEQADATIDNLEAILRAGGATLADVVKSTVHLSDMTLFPRFNATYAQRFPEPRPVRTTVGSDLSVISGMLVEIDVVAYVGG